MNRRLIVSSLLSLVTLSACASLDGNMSALKSALTSVSSLSGGVGKLSSMLSGVPGLDQLTQLAGFSDQASKLGATLKQAATGAPENTKAGLASVQNMLGKLGGESFKLDSLKALAPADLTNKVTEFTGLGKGLGTAATDLLGMLK